MDTTPKAVHMGLTFWPIPKFDGPSQAFGAGHECYFPRYERPKVPRKYEDAAESVFFKGGELPALDPRVDRKQAAGMLRALLSSFAPAHEAKITTAGYALWVWSTPEAIDAAEAA